MVVSIRNAILAKHGLNGFCKNSPVRIEFRLNFLLVNFDLLKTADGLSNSLQRVAKGKTNVSLQRRIRKISLHTRTRKLIRKSSTDCIANLDICFAVFETNGVDFVRHGATTNFCFNRNLFKVFHADVEPHVCIKVSQNIVEMTNFIQQVADIVVTFNLSSNRIKSQSQILNYKAFRMEHPSIVGECDRNCCIVSSCTIEFGSNGNMSNAPQALCKAIGINSQFFANSGWSGRLTMSMCKHRNICIFACHLGNKIQKFSCFGLPDFFECRRNHQCISAVGDVFRRATNMHKALESTQAEVFVTFCFKLFSNEEFNGLYIMVCFGFDFFDSYEVFVREVLVDRHNHRKKFGIKVIQSRTARITGNVFNKVLQPVNLDFNPILYQGKFREIRCKCLTDLSIPPIKWANSQMFCRNVFCDESRIVSFHRN